MGHGPRSARKRAPSEPKRKVGEISRLVTRGRFLEADEDYQAAIVKTDEESNALICQHGDDQDEIEMQLSRLIPRDFDKAKELLEHAIKLMDGGPLTNGADVMMLKNILESLPGVLGKYKGSRAQGSCGGDARLLDALLDIFHDRGKLRTLRDALERGGTTP